VSDYLTILSVFQTCEYQGVKVLKFLLTGETTFTFPDPIRSNRDRMRQDAIPKQ
jgi:hypothetical protein